MDAITIITGPRTGAGHLFALLRNIEAVAPRDGLFVDGHADVTVRMDAAEAEARTEGKSLLVVKATSTMPRDVVERELLGRTGMRAIVVVRRQIDAYVSLAKATALNAFRERDLTGVKQCLDRIVPLASKYPGWRSYLHLAEAQFHRLRGDPEAACAACERGLALATPDAEDPGRTIVAWPSLAGAYIDILVELDRFSIAHVLDHAANREHALCPRSRRVLLGRSARHVSGCPQPRQRGLALLIDPEAGEPVAAHYVRLATRDLHRCHRPAVAAVIHLVLQQHRSRGSHRQVSARGPLQLAPVHARPSVSSFQPR